MGITDYIFSTTNALNQNAIKPLYSLCCFSFSSGCTAATVIGAASYSAAAVIGSTTYSYGSAAAAKISNSIKGDHAVQKLTQQLHDQDSRSKMTQFATSCAKNAAVFTCREGLKTVPRGGPIVEIVSRSLPGSKKSENHKTEEVNALRSEIRELQAVVHKMGKEQSNAKEELNQAEAHELHTYAELEFNKHEAYRNQAAAIRFLMVKNLQKKENKQPAEYLQEMLMRGFVGTHVINDLNEIKECPRTKPSRMTED
ncbi:uncharacterized protein LOC126685792 [Mercurialis annua]|uniref:uncharacterized protein LOC126685792 n=1 Tax=Mercurialis annua TaxID=3986 RepID=UPI00216065F7|nr:uncharacterized protein LOC126685792 [Mercurialis annua]